MTLPRALRSGDRVCTAKAGLLPGPIRLLQPPDAVAWERFVWKLNGEPYFEDNETAKGQGPITAIAEPLSADFPRGRCVGWEDGGQQYVGRIFTAENSYIRTVDGYSGVVLPLLEPGHRPLFVREDEATLGGIFANLASRQVSLSAEENAAIFDNLEDLYEGDDAAPADETALLRAENARMEAALKLADALAEQAWHVYLGASIGEKVKIHNAALALELPAAAYGKARAALQEKKA